MNVYHGRKYTHLIWLAFALLVIGIVSTSLWQSFAHPRPVQGSQLVTSTIAWGRNEFGQLGDGTNEDRLESIILPGHLLQADAGSMHTIALKNDNTVVAWGMNSFNQLGDGTQIDRNSPVAVDGLSNVTAIAAGGAHNLARKSDGTVWAWGYNAWGQLGDGTRVQHSTPVQVSGLTDVSAIAAGASFSLALTSDGSVWAWGANNYGQLGDGELISDFSYSATPIPVVDLTNVTKIAAGGGHALAVKDDGTLWAWGRYEIASDVTSSTPVQITGVSNVKEIDASSYTSLVVQGVDRTVFAWGINEDGQLGDGTTTDRTTPVQVVGLNDINGISAGDFHSLAYFNSTSMWIHAWGRNSEGQLGDGTRTGRLIPGPFYDRYLGLNFYPISLSAGTYHNIVIQEQID